MKEYIQIHPDDNVMVALVPLERGRKIPLPSGGEVTLLQEIPAGHKFAVKEIQAGEAPIKYGCKIGVAKEDIHSGEWIHTHNVKTGLGEILSYEYRPEAVKQQPAMPATFLGYKRKDGRVGIRNEVWIIPTVGCVNSIAKTLEKQAQELVKGRFDGLHAFTHPYGCSQMGDDMKNTQRLLASLIHHPNAGGVLVLGLGCENNYIELFKESMYPYDPERVRFLQCQDVEDEMETGLTILKELSDLAATDVREEVDISNLVVGLKCGGSDGLSGITANPLVGKFCDRVTAAGGSAVLTEVPEMFGAETLLMNRCINEEVFHKTVRLVNNFKEYFMSHNQTIYENPSPGNKKGGITTLEDKSLGCTQKAGSAPVIDVLGYGDCVRKKGLSLLSGPGNDLVASTVLAASGCHLVLFTTGRGTPFGCPVPTIKIASNSSLAKRKQDWIDFNAGVIVEDRSMEETAEDFFQFVCRVASGEVLTKSEIHDCREIAIFKDGITL